jgi:hypothetical protein
MLGFRFLMFAWSILLWTVVGGGWIFFFFSFYSRLAIFRVHPEDHHLPIAREAHGVISVLRLMLD